MKLSLPIRKQLLVAGYSSPAISMLIITPMFILMRMKLSDYPVALGFSTGVVFLVWLVNIGIYVLAGQQWRYAVSVFLGLVLIMGLVHSIFFHQQDRHFGSWTVNLHFHVIIFLAVDMVILILQDLAVSREKNAVIERENTELRLRNVEAINLQLMQQVQPHFLFNSLSTLKSLIGISPEQASEYLVRLSGFLRASISSHADSTVQLGRELDLCVDYLEMQRIRFGDALQFTIGVPDEVREAFYLPVFSLQLLAENAIKHNVLTKERPLHIAISYREKVITVTNNLQKKAVPGGTEGTGLVNLRERYKALTGDPVVIDEGAEQYSVSIKVITHENSDH